MITGEKHDEKTNQNDDIPGDDNDDQPTGDNLNDSERDKCWEEKKFVCDGIQIGTQFGPLMSDAGNQTVDTISNPGNHKSYKSPPKVFIDDENDEERDHQDSGQGEGIREVHGWISS